MWSLMRKLGVAGLMALGVLVGSAAFSRETARDPAQELATVALSALPNQAQQTQRLIKAGGPFPNTKDGVVFGNYERHLPRRERGFYREYTVSTPGAHNRGARRIVCGGVRPAQPEACFYTADHYTSFQRIVP